MAVPATTALVKMEDSSGAEMTVKITAFQWRWKYEYLDHDVSFISSLDQTSNEARQLNSGIAPESVDNYLLIAGNVDYTDDTVELTTVELLTGFDPSQGSPLGSYTLRWLDSGGGEIGSTSFEPSTWETSRGYVPNGGSFTVFIPADPLIDSIEVVHNALVVATREASANPPTVQVLTPNGGETLGSDIVTITWATDDPDGDEVLSTVQYSADEGLTWATLAFQYPLNSLEIERDVLPASDKGIVRIRVNDGFLSATDTSDSPFTVINNPPIVALATPETDPYWNGQIIELRVQAIDTEDGALDGASVVWSSNLEGDLGSGASLEFAAADLVDGIHFVTAVVTDSSGATDSVSLELWINVNKPLFMDGFESIDP